MLSFERGNQVTNPKQGVSLMPPLTDEGLRMLAGSGRRDSLPVSGRTPLPWTGGPSEVAYAGESPQVQMRLS